MTAEHLFRGIVSRPGRLNHHTLLVVLLHCRRLYQTVRTLVRVWDRHGIYRLAIGTDILVDGYRAKDGSTRANGRDIPFPDGRKLFVGSSGTGAPYDPTRR